MLATGFGYDTEVRRAQGAKVARVLPHVRDIRRLGSAALDLAWTAAGRFDAYYEYGVQGILVASYRVSSLAAEGMATLDPLEDGERGSITFTASVAAQDGQIGQLIYGSAKAGVNGLVLPMARDLSDLGIRVNCIMPGIFATPLMLGAAQKVLDSLSASVPFPKRLGKPEEFASLALEFVRNSYFNGQCIRLDGAIRMAPR